MKDGWRRVLLCVLFVALAFLVWCLSVGVYNFHVVFANKMNCHHYLMMNWRVMHEYAEDNNGLMPSDLAALPDLYDYFDASMLRCPQSGKCYEINWRYLKQTPVRFDENVIILWDKEPYHQYLGVFLGHDEGHHGALIAKMDAPMLTPVELQKKLEKAEKFPYESEESK